jgi:hypothetical protein
MNPVDELSKITLEARTMRRQYVAGLLLNAWHAVFSWARIVPAQKQGMTCPQ